MFLNTRFTIDGFDFLFSLLNVFVMDVTLTDLIIQKALKWFGLVDFELSCIIIVQLSDSESHPLLFIHLFNFHLLMQSNLEYLKKFTSSKSVCFFFLKNFSYSSSKFIYSCWEVSYVKSFRLFTSSPASLVVVPWN